MKTTQEIFNIVAAHLLTQMVRSERRVSMFNDDMQCAYRGANGRVDAEDLHLVRQLQLVHDNVQPGEWRSELKRLARSFCLEFNEEAYGHKAVEIVSGPTEQERQAMCGRDPVRNSDLGIPS